MDPEKTEDKKFFINDVQSGKHLLFAVCTKNDKIIGFIHAFSFNKEISDCETGILILLPENYGKGYGYEAYKILLKYLGEEHKLKSTYILMHPQNQSALRLYKKLGYKKSGMEKDGRPPGGCFSTWRTRSWAGRCD